LKRKTKTESEFIQFKFLTNRESSDFLQIETENQNRKWVFPIQVFNKHRKFRLLLIETENQNRKWIYPIQVFNKQRKFRLFTNWTWLLKRKAKIEKTVFQFLDFNKQIKKSTKRQHLIKFMLKFDLLQTDKHSIKICYAGKISDFYVAQIL